MRNVGRDDHDSRMTNERPGLAEWPMRGRAAEHEECDRVGSGDPGGPSSGPAGINCYVSAASNMCQAVTSSNMSKPHLQIQLQKLSRDPVTVFINRSRIMFTTYTWASVKLSLDASRTLSWPTMYWVLQKWFYKALDFSCCVAYLLNSSSILSSCSGVKIVLTLLFFILRPPSGRMSSEFRFSFLECPFLHWFLRLWYYTIIWIKMGSDPIWCHFTLAL